MTPNRIYARCIHKKGRFQHGNSLFTIYVRSLWVVHWQLPCATLAEELTGIFEGLTSPNNYMPLSLRSFPLALFTASILWLSSCSKSTEVTPQPPAQVQTGAILGSYSPITGLASVTATPVGGGTSSTASLSTLGTYTFGSLPVGNYNLVYVAAAGYVSPPTQTVTVIANYTLPIPALTLTSAKLALLTTPRWRISAYTSTEVTNGQSTTTDVYATTAACARDNFYKFNTDKSFIFDEGPTNCGLGLPQTFQEFWDFDANETELVMSATRGGSIHTRYQIRQLTSTTLRMVTTYTITTGTTSTEDVTFTAF
jgi:hypothetical protein